MRPARTRPPSRTRTRAEITDCGYWPADALPRPISDFTVRRIEDALSLTNRYPLPATVGPRHWLE